MRLVLPLQRRACWTTSEAKARSELAHGQHCVLEIAVALTAKSKLLLVDEPTAGMSPEQTELKIDLIQQLVQGRTVVVTLPERAW